MQISVGLKLVLLTREAGLRTETNEERVMSLAAHCALESGRHVARFLFGSNFKFCAI